jgi:Amt family ammonium transporter
LLIGKRKDYGKEPLTPHNIPLTVLGTALLWFGWFGFNAGSSLSAGNLSVLAFLNTHIAASMAGLSYILVEWIKRRKPTTLGAATGIVAGLVAITPACGFVAPSSSLLIGLIAGVLSYFAISLKPRFGYDDSLDVVGVHGVNGAWGAFATGLLAEKSLNPAGANGLFFGPPSLLIYQLLSVIAVGLYSFLMTFLILKLIAKFVALKVTNFDEEVGLDIASHGESSYS